MRKNWHHIPALIALCLVLALAASCGRIIAPDAAETAAPDAAPAAENVPEADGGAHTQSISALLPGSYADPSDGEVRLDVYEAGGVLLLEESGWDGDRLGYYYAQELWPDDRAALFDPAAGSITGLCSAFADIDAQNYYIDSAPDITLELTEEGFRLVYASGVTSDYIRQGDEGYHSAAAEQLSLLQETAPDAVPVDDFAGVWTTVTDVCAVYLSLSEDGSAVYACKVAGNPLVLMIGAWAADEESGVLYLRGEKVGCGYTLYNQELSCRLAEGGLYLSDRGDEKLLPFSGEVRFESADENWLFPEALNVPLFTDNYDEYAEDMWITEYAADRLAESGGYKTEGDGETYYYMYYVPEILIESEDAAAANAEIEERFLTLAEEMIADVEAGYSPAYPYISWYSEEWEDVVSIVVCAQTDWESADYGVYNFDTATGARLTNAELLARLNITEEGYLNAVRTAAEAYFENAFSGIPEADRESYGYNERLAWTLSDENISMDMLMYIDYEGDLTVIAPIGSIAGADWYYHYLYPFLDAKG